jgi:hypothetical protein
MTRKDYIALAAAFADLRPACVDQGEHAILDRAIEAVADRLAVDNGAFNRTTFYTAALWAMRNHPSSVHA